MIPPYHTVLKVLILVVLTPYLNWQGFLPVCDVIRDDLLKEILFGVFHEGLKEGGQPDNGPTLGVF